MSLLPKPERNPSLANPFFFIPYRMFKTRALRIRVRAKEAATLTRKYTPDNPVVASAWPPALAPGEPHVITREYCKNLMRSLALEEEAKLKKLQTFTMPAIREGDLVEVKYELSRTRQSFTQFQGYCIEIRRKRLVGGFTLKNTFDGIGVSQFFPFNSPRLLNVTVIRPLVNPPAPITLDVIKPRSRNYRYQWHKLMRHRHSEGKRVHWRKLRQGIGVMSLEPKLRSELVILRRRYNNLRIEAGLPPYLWPGPYHIHMRQSRQVTAELNRRMIVYAWDERKKRATKIAERNRKNRWGTFKLDKKPKFDAVESIPSYHPLNPGNLPK
jgi:large subunit ribosomal protein L19